MSYDNFTLDVDAEGIAVLTWSMPGKSLNVIDLKVIEELDAILERIENDGGVKGVVLRSGAKDFSGGADLAMLQGLLADFRAQHAAGDVETASRALFEGSRRLSQLFRRIETGSKPWVVALAGTVMGGATEWALACHARIAADDGRLKMALPEVKVGLFPGAGGTQRVMRMCDPQAGLEFLMRGRALNATKAKAMKLIDAVATPETLVDAAKAMIRNGSVAAVKPWDEKGFKLPGGKVFSPAGFQFWPAANAIYRRETYDNYPGIRAMLNAVFEGLQLPMDLALEVESRYFAYVLTTREAHAMIRSLFVSMQELNKGARRPAEVGTTKVAKIGVLGAGFMGAGIAYVTARAGIEVILLDRDRESAERGKAHSDTLISKAVTRGQATPEQKDALLARIHPTDDYAALADCDLVIEAVFEDRAVKRTAIEAAEAVLPPSAIFASNTST